ncbi:MAG: transcription antitermination factor NusB [Candidatus Cloacimonas sp. 4484_209]|nr:MAG: transcription antitermination factor NusB [Candidatus Cloacimonas sp. 4484_209]
MGKRRKAREIVLDVLYYYEIASESRNSLLERITQKKGISKEIKEYATRLLSTTIENLEVIDSKLKKIIKNWDLDRVAIIDKSIMRFASAEILFLPDIPVKVSIDEAVELAKKYSTENSGSFVNGILDKIARQANLLNHSNKG